MHDLSYRVKNSYLDYMGLKLSAEVFTHDNIYTADPDKTEIRDFSLCAKGLLASGGQEPCGGSLSLCVSDGEITVSAELEGKNIRCIKVAVDGLPEGYVTGTIDCKRREIDDFGFVLHYPEGWRELATPLTFLTSGEDTFYFYSNDNTVREKRFAFMKRDGAVRAELIFEEDATDFSNKIKAPAWSIGKAEDVSAIKKKYAEHVIESYGLSEFEKRSDAPDWLQDISLVVAGHCMHWTGYVFNTYDDIIRQLEYVTSKIDGKRVLLYLPGFEGRYYFDYGTYGPSRRLGGKDGLKRLVDAAHKMGVRVMLMFGINVVSTESQGYYEWGIPSLFVPASGGICNHLDCDMDSARHYHHGSQGIVNPAAPKWQNRLVEQITALRDEYCVDGAFLDIAAVWVNDSNFKLFDGVKRLCERLREGHPEFLVSGEGWYDGLSACMPLFHSGHTYGEMHYHDEFLEDIFTPYAREFAHLCLGDPSRHSTGVHELGTNHTWRAPCRRGVIPTLTLVDGTVELGKEGTDEIINDAKLYAERYCGKKRFYN